MLANKPYKSAAIFLVFYWNVRHVFSGEKLSLSRSKRTLLWEKGNSRLQIITGVGAPVDLDVETVIIAGIIKGNYRLPSNISDIKPFGNNVYYEKRKKRAFSRWDIYEFLSQLWQLRGYGGKSCILRAICELSHRPVDKNYSLFDELVHTVFTPSTTKESLRQHSDNEYFAAQRFGKLMGDFCKSKFSDCGVDIVDLFTM